MEWAGNLESSPPICSLLVPRTRWPLTPTTSTSSSDPFRPHRLPTLRAAPIIRVSALLFSPSYRAEVSRRRSRRSMRAFSALGGEGGGTGEGDSARCAAPSGAFSEARGGLRGRTSTVAACSASANFQWVLDNRLRSSDHRNHGCWMHYPNPSPKRGLAMKTNTKKPRVWPAFPRTTESLTYSTNILDRSRSSWESNGISMHSQVSRIHWSYQGRSVKQQDRWISEAGRLSHP